jgi:hypothetical protein
MALAWPLLAGLAVAPLLGGNWRALAQIRLRAVWLFFFAFGLQVAAFPFEWMPWRTPDGVAIKLWLASYAVLLLAIVCNARLPGVPIVAVGLMSNLAAIVANGGHMPALPSALRAAGLHFHVSRNSAEMAQPHLAWLVDRWAAPHWIPYANVYSVGDLTIIVGSLTFALLATGALRRRPRRGRQAATSAT